MLATPRGITQPHTSFIGSACQGIHHTPVTKHTDTQTNRYKHQNTKKKDTRVHYTVLTQHNPHTQPTTTKVADSRKGPTGTTKCCPRHPTVHQHIQSFVTQPDASTNQAPCKRTTITGQPHHHPDSATMTRGCVSTRQIILSWQSHTRRHQPHKHPQLWAQK